MLRVRGIPIGIGVAPLDAAVLWDHRSLPLHDLIQRMLYESNNHFAEQILRTIGDVGPQVVGDTSGIQTERKFLAARGIPTPGLHLVDGSGLAHANRIAAITLARILAAAELGGSGFSRLYYLLPQGGRQGTLKDYYFTTALGRVRAKSGHLDNVNSLAGYVNTYHHGRLVFAFLVNGSPGDPDAAIVRALDRLAVM
jgi:D-alanyl-D-alanine carboxypeptidase/D-alanyl-D-alanine-endopeptidase (penicillin-binding protein 4)